MSKRKYFLLWSIFLFLVIAVISVPTFLLQQKLQELSNLQKLAIQSNLATFCQDDIEGKIEAMQKALNEFSDPKIKTEYYLKRLQPMESNPNDWVASCTSSLWPKDIATEDRIDFYQWDKYLLEHYKLNPLKIE